MQSEGRHSATNQVRVRDNKYQVRSGSQVVTILDGMVPDLCNRCVAIKWCLQGIYEDRGSMCVPSKMGQKSVNLEAASDVDKCKIWHKSVKIMEEAIEWLRTKKDKDDSGAMRFCRGKHHEYLVTSLDYLNMGECRVTMCNHLNETFDKTLEKHGEVWIVVEKQCLRSTAAHEDLVTGDEDQAVASSHTILA